MNSGKLTSVNYRRIPVLLFILTLLAVQLGCNNLGHCAERANDTPQKLLECVTVDGVYEHLQALQAIADENDGNRAAGTAGYDASLSYVANTLEAAGYEVELDEFDFTVEPPALLQQTEPAKVDYQAGRITGSGSGRVTGPVIAVDLALGEEPWTADPSTNSSGCETSDFEGLDFSGSNDIALVQAGGCFTAEKAVNAEAAGAEAMVVLIKEFYDYEAGEAVDRADKFGDGSLSDIKIPLVGVHIPHSMPLVQDGVEATLEVAVPREVKQYNVIAELSGSAQGQVVIVGAHLDSVLFGPGISDNGSGSAAVLETAVQMAKVQPENSVRFIWWAAEEAGPVGSRVYLDSLTEEELGEIGLYLNFDMIASPNPVFMIYDRDDYWGEKDGPGVEKSAEIAKLFASYFETVNRPYKDSDVEVGSDHIFFSRAGIPTGGLFTGAVDLKKAEEAKLWGGTASEAHDPCYHKPCDTLDNIDRDALKINAGGVAFAALHYAMDSELKTGNGKTK